MLQQIPFEDLVGRKIKAVWIDGEHIIICVHKMKIRKDEVFLVDEAFAALRARENYGFVEINDHDMDILHHAPAKLIDMGIVNEREIASAKRRRDRLYNQEQRNRELRTLAKLKEKYENKKPD